MPSALETAIKLSQSGKKDLEISSEMKEMGFGAREINEAINGVKIKKSITEKPISGVEEMGEEMEPSIMEKAPEEEVEVPRPLQPAKEKYKAPEAAEQAEYYPPEAAAPYYPQYPQPQQQPQYYTEQQQPPGVDIELIEEIAEETVNEKFNEFKAKIGDVPAFRQATERRIEEIEERLKRIEINLDKIQISVLGKIKEYGENVKTLSGEMQTVESSISKIINPLISNVKELSEITEKLKERAVVKGKGNKGNK